MINQSEVKTKYEECTPHEIKQRTIGYWSCDCRSHRYFPFQAVENLTHYYNFERNANKKYALELIVEQYNGSTAGNQTLADIAKIRLQREFS